MESRPLPNASSVALETAGRPLQHPVACIAADEYSSGESSPSSLCSRLSPRGGTAPLPTTPRRATDVDENPAFGTVTAYRALDCDEDLTTEKHEKLTMDGIESTPDVLGGEPRLEGRRISVRQIAAMVLEGGMAPADVADQLRVLLAEVHLALAYHYANPEEMREVEREHRDAAAAIREQALDPPERATR